MEEDIKQQVADIIREARKTKGFTQYEMGKMIGVAGATYGLYESGKQNLTVETLQKIAKALGLKFEPAFR